MVRKSLAPRLRLLLLDRTGGRCPLCGTALGGGGEVHHLEFVAEGGGDDPDNLAYLCERCHGVFAHRLYLQSERRYLRAAAEHWYRLVAVGRLIADRQPWPSVAAAVLGPEIFSGSVRLGAHGLLAEWIDWLLCAAPAEDPATRLTCFRLKALAARVATYFEGDSVARARLEILEAALPASPLEEHDLYAYEIARAKVFHQLELREAEAASLERLVRVAPHDSELAFRRTSFALRYGDALPPIRQSVPIGRPASVGENISFSNLRADRGRALARDDRYSEAYLSLAEAFSEARRLFHRRGLFNKAMRLAELSLILGEGELAAKWFVIGEQFRSDSRNLALAREPLRLRISALIGEEALARTRVGHTSPSAVPGDPAALRAMPRGAVQVEAPIDLP
jgi:tetratricopeptide (TPR) repeat protein